MLLQQDHVSSLIDSRKAENKDKPCSCPNQVMLLLAGEIKYTFETTSWIDRSTNGSRCLQPRISSFRRKDKRPLHSTHARCRPCPAGGLWNYVGGREVHYAIAIFTQSHSGPILCSCSFVYQQHHAADPQKAEFPVFTGCKTPVSANFSTISYNTKSHPLLTTMLIVTGTSSSWNVIRLS